MTMKTEGIVIREQNTGEQDKLITVLTKDSGLIRAFVNGGRNPRNRNVSSTGLLCYSRFSFESAKSGNFFVREATPLKFFFNMREDIIILSLAQYLAELALELAPREEAAGEFLPLMLNSLHLLTTSKKDKMLIKAVAELRMLSLSGYMPQIVACKKCGCYEAEKMFFNTSTGEIFCESCSASKNLSEISSGVLTALRHICLSDSGKIFSFTLPPEALLTLSGISEKYLLAITNKKFKTLTFYKKMAEI